MVVPVAVGVPLMTPVALLIDVPAGRFAAEYVRDSAAVGVGRAQRHGDRGADDALLPAGVGDGDRLADLRGGDGQGAGQRQVPVRVAEQDRVVARRGRPGVGRGVPVLQVRLGQRERHRLALAGGQVDAGEALQLLGRLAGGGRVGDVQLDHVGALAGAGVGHGRRHVRAALGQRADRQVAEGEVVYDRPNPKGNSGVRLLAS